MLRCFDAPFVTAEDRARSAMYSDERNRTTSLSAVGSVQAWLDSLDIVVSAEPLNEANLDRTAQLFNKTNQMNLATRRLSREELVEWAAAPDHAVLTFRVADRFGDSGLTGVVGLAYEGTRALLTDFLLSCRVMGRGVEDTLLHAAVNHARARGAAELVAEFRPTERNAPCLEFLRRSGLRASGDNRFAWTTSESYPQPDFVTLHDRAGVAPAGNR